MFFPIFYWLPASPGRIKKTPPGTRQLCKADEPGYGDLTTGWGILESETGEHGARVRWNYIPSGKRLQFAIQNGHRHRGFTHENRMVTSSLR
jgi:hypothetical protein